MKLVYEDFKQTVPKDNLPGIEQMLARQFEQIQYPILLKRENAASREDLEWKLRAKGSSLEREKRIFMEKVVHMQWFQEQLKTDDEITHEQMLAWYEAHLSEFEKPARVRWEELMVGFSHYPSTEQAYAAMAELGNQVLLGASLADVAKARSDGPTAADGGRRPWTTQGSLASTAVDRALFTLAPGQLSPILEGPNGYHIVRVIERQERTRTPFADAQKEVKKKIRAERTNKQLQEFVAKLHKRYPVWTIFDSVAKRPEATATREVSRY